METHCCCLQPVLCFSSRDQLITAHMKQTPVTVISNLNNLHLFTGRNILITVVVPVRLTAVVWFLINILFTELHQDCMYVTLIKHLRAHFWVSVCVALSSRHCFRSGPNCVPEMLWSFWTSTTLTSMSENTLCAVCVIWGKHLYPTPTYSFIHYSGPPCRLFKPLHSYHHPLQSIRLCYIPPLSCCQVIILLCFVPSARERQKHIILWNQATGFEMKETWKLEHSPLMLLSLFSSFPSPVMRSCRSTCYSWCRCCVMSLIMTAPSPTSCWSARRATAR